MWSFCLVSKLSPHKAKKINLTFFIVFLCGNSHNYVRGSITIYIINLHRSRKKIKLAGTLRNNTVHQYLLQPYGTDGLRARWASFSVLSYPDTHMVTMHWFFSVETRIVFGFVHLHCPYQTKGLKGADGANKNNPHFCCYLIYLFFFFPNITSLFNTGLSNNNGSSTVKSGSVCVMCKTLCPV